MKRMRRNNKGMTLLEVMVAMAVFGIISVPLVMSCISPIVITKINQDQIELNAVTRTVKEAVVNAIKTTGYPIDTQNTIDNTGTGLSTDIVTGSACVILRGDTNLRSGRDLEILVGQNGTTPVYSSYTFDATLENVPDTMYDPAKYDSSVHKYSMIDAKCTDTCRYEITINKKDSNGNLKQLKKLLIDINMLEDNT
ncbi:MAG: prepilin-type N-terminal cleavage/methylation domain-containing protein [Bacillota bacterium]|nr:prepilin-type N-terminal cleavage/methylation domain-containing protein [Bacillota bacterium]